MGRKKHAPFYALFTSIKLFIAVLSMCALTALIGIIVPQSQEYDDYGRLFGPTLTNIIIDCGWDHIFSSPWFMAPLAVFCFNLLCCIGSRWWSLIFFFLREKRARTGATGSLLLHGGVFLLVAGGMVQYFFGDTEAVTVSEGTQETVKKFHIAVFLHDFSIIRNDKGEITNYRSTIELRDANNHVLANAATMVNAPLIYRGIYFYQMQYGPSPAAVKRFRAVAVDSTGDTLLNGNVPFKTIIPLGKGTASPAHTLSLQCSEFLCDFYYDPESGKAMTQSTAHNNPAFKITLFRNGSAIDSQWIFQKFPQMNGPLAGRCSIAIPSYEPAFYSGIQVQKKPGTIIILIGIALVSIGLAMVFIFPFRQIR